jgi:hypothetical protein
MIRAWQVTSIPVSNVTDDEAWNVTINALESSDS